MWASPFTLKNMWAAARSLLKYHKTMLLPGEGWEVKKGEGFIGEQWGYAGAMCDWEVPSESLWLAESTAVGLSCINRTKVPCVLGCDLPLLGRQGAEERTLGTGSEDLGMSLSSGTRCLISLNHSFPNWKTRRKMTHWMCFTGVLYGLNKNRVWKAWCKLESSIKM